MHSCNGPLNKPTEMQFTTLALIAAAAVVATPAPLQGRGGHRDSDGDNIGIATGTFPCYRFAYTSMEDCQAALSRCRSTISMCGTNSEIVYIPFGIN